MRLSDKYNLCVDVLTGPCVMAVLSPSELSLLTARVKYVSTMFGADTARQDRVNNAFVERFLSDIGVLRALV